MKILLVGFKLSIGNQLMMEFLAEALQAQGHEVAGLGDRAFRPANSFPFYGVSDSRAYQAVALQTLNMPLWFQIARLVKRERPDVCYVISSHSLNVPILALLRQSTECPLLVSHIHDPTPHSSSPVAFWIGLSQWLQLRFSDRVVVYGERLKALCAAHNRYPLERIVVVTHGAYRPARHAQPEPAVPQWFSLLGRIRAYKGIDAFLEAARVVLQSRPDARFFIGGEGDLAPFEEGLRRLGERIVVINHVLSNDEVDKIVQQSWAVVLPYRDGTQSGVIPVAYYNACPVIVSDVGSLPELVTPDAGTVVPPNEVGHLATAMLDWMDVEKRTEAGKTAFQFYKKHLIWDDIVPLFLKDLFESISTPEGIQ